MPHSDQVAPKFLIDLNVELLLNAAQYLIK